MSALDASDGRLYNLQFDDQRTFQLVGSDSGLLAAPPELTELLLSPGERAELIVALRPGERAVLQSVEPDMGVDSSTDRNSGSRDSFDLLQLRAADHLLPSEPLPDRLATIDAPVIADVVETRTFELGNDTINGRKMDMERVDVAVEDGATEIWEITNDHGRPHSFHPHLIHFLVLDVDGGTPTAASQRLERTPSTSHQAKPCASSPASTATPTRRAARLRGRVVPRRALRTRPRNPRSGRDASEALGRQRGPDTLRVWPPTRALSSVASRRGAAGSTRPSRASLRPGDGDSAPF